jgi:hypothetical protein
MALLITDTSFETLALEYLSAATSTAMGADKPTLIATMFGEPLYLEQVTPANVEIKRKELPPGEFDDSLREYRGRRT